MSAMLWRDLRLAWARGWGWATGAVFFVLFIAVVAIGVGGDATLLGRAGPGIIWSGLLFGVLIGAPGLFAADVTNGGLDQLRLKGLRLWEIVVVRMVGLALTAVLPLLVAIPLAGELLALGPGMAARLMAAVLVAGPALAGYGVLAGALAARAGGAGLLGVLVTLPLLIPVLIFGAAAVESEASSLWLSVEMRALAGISLIGAVVGTVGAVAALSINAE